VRQASAAAGRGFGLARLLAGLPGQLARGRIPLPLSRLAAAGLSAHQLLAGTGGDATVRLIGDVAQDARWALAAAHADVANLPQSVRPAFLPLALVEPYLRAVERGGAEGLRRPIEIAPLTRFWRLAAAHWLGRL
jgi:phytoene synthase